MATKNEQIPIQGFDDHDAFQIQPQFAANVRNVRSLRERIVKSPGGTNLAPTPLPFSGSTTSGFGVRVGNFKMPTAAGNQTITHNLNQSPMALILFGAKSKSLTGRNETANADMGFTDGTTSRAIGAGINTTGGSGSVSDTQQVYENTLYATDIGGILRTATFVSWTDTDFVITWNSVPIAPRYIGYMIIGGAGISAKVLEWTMTSAAGTQAVTGAGFAPQAVIHIHNGQGSTGDVAGGRYGVGAMDTARQWAHCLNGADNFPNVNECASMRSTAYAIQMISSTGAPTYQASLTSLDADGFTMLKNTPPGSNVLVASLCLGGFQDIRVDTITPDPVEVSAPAHQAFDTLGFMPTGYFLATMPSDSDVVTTGGIYFGHGATDGTNQFAYGDYVQNLGRDAGNESNAGNMLLDIQFGGLINSAVYKRRAVQYSMDTDGYTVNVITGTNANHDVIAFDYAAGGTIIGNVGIPRNYPDVWVSPPGPAVENYVMLTSASAFIYTPVTSSTGIWTPTAETYTGSATDRFGWVNTQGIAAWSQGVDNFRQWDGTTFSDLITTGTNHAAHQCIAFNERIVSIYPVESGTNFPTQIRWCVNGNVNDWGGTGSGSLEVIDYNQAPLTGGFVLADRAFIAKERQLIELIATDTLLPVFDTAVRVNGMGILATHSVAVGEQFAFWLGPDDIYMWDGSTLQAVGERVYNTVTSLIDYQNLDQIQGVVYTPDSQYWLVIPPYIFVYDYRRDIWDWDDVQNFAAIGVLNATGNNLFTADINKSVFLVVGDPQCTTTRVDFQATSWLGNPIDSYFETKDYTAEELLRQSIGSGWRATLWDINSLREVRFQSIPGNIVECAVSLDRGVTWVDVQNVTVNATGVGVAWFQRPFSMIRFRFRRYSTDSYEIRGQWGHDIEGSGYQYP